MTDAKENICAPIAKDKALESEATAVANVEKLTRLVRDLHRLCINFVNFKDLYDDGPLPSSSVARFISTSGPAPSA